MPERSAGEIAAGVSSGSIRPAELVDDCLHALVEQGGLNAVITLCRDQALERARDRPEGPLAGVPVLVKDFFDTAGVRTTYGSAIYRDRVPDRTAQAVQRLEDAGAIVVGKSNLDEFAWGVTGQNPHWGDVQNPRLPGRIAGGSSAGNAAALAAGLVPLALGSDTGGSIRMPSGCCGTVGYKPTLGAVPTEGAFPLCPSFDTVGPMARSVADCALAHSVLSGQPVPEPALEGRTVGVLVHPPLVGAPEPEPPPRDERAWQYAEPIEQLGARVVEAELPGPGTDTWPLFYAEARETHRETFPSRRDEYGEVVRAKLDDAQRFGPAEADEARRAVLAWRRRAATEPAIDLFLSPTLGVEEIPPIDVSELEIRLRFSSFTRPFSYLGWAAIAIGDFQLAGRDDATVLAAALAWEEAYGPPA
jgi:aspartyl-tRNA(Asn)/glutamyl-tRNA(Gln) amidotransferase subunit A